MPENPYHDIDERFKHFMRTAGNDSTGAAILTLASYVVRGTNLNVWLRPDPDANSHKINVEGVIEPASKEKRT